MAKIRVSVVYEYEPKPENYPGCTTVEEMLELDRENLNMLAEIAIEYGNISLDVVE